MEIEIIRNYLSTDKSLDITELRINNRKITNKNLDNMADGIIERFNSNPKKEDSIKKIITLTANEFGAMGIKEIYVAMES